MEPCKHMSIPGSEPCEDCLLSKDGKLRRQPTDTISRREYFIGQALAGIIAKYGTTDSVYVGHDSHKDEDATEARISESIELADALIARLDGEGKE